MSKDITQVVTEMVATCLAEQGHDDIDYIVSGALIPGEGGRPQTVITITFVVNAVTLGDTHSGSVMIPPAIPDPTAMVDLVRQLASGLKEAKAKAADQVLASSNGHGQADPTRLIVPGS